jgi:tetratricopeptide (TPR) repeat protein
MTEMDMASAFPSQRSRQHRLLGLKRVTATVSSLAIALSVWVPSAIADPFRSTDPHQIDSQTENAFKAVFEQGNYKEAAQLLKQAQPGEPMAYAMKAALAYIDQDWNVMGENAHLTRETAEKLVQTDPLRGHLYIAVGHFLEGAYALSTQGTVKATPEVLSKLQQVFSNLADAEKINPNDPELNLIKGYMDLMLSVNLPFSNPDQAIERLKDFAAPAYLAQRGIAIGYRDLDQPDQALTAVDQAIGETPNNPELYYLKAQILVRKGNNSESLPFFRRALEKKDQLPVNLVRQIIWEQCRTKNRVRGTNRDCDAARDRLLTEE